MAEAIPAPPAPKPAHLPAGVPYYGSSYAMFGGMSSVLFQQLLLPHLSVVSVIRLCSCARALRCGIIPVPVSSHFSNRSSFLASPALWEGMFEKLRSTPSARSPSTKLSRFIACCDSGSALLRLFGDDWRELFIRLWCFLRIIRADTLRLARRTVLLENLADVLNGRGPLESLLPSVSGHFRQPFFMYCSLTHFLPPDPAHFAGMYARSERKPLSAA
jgi:hypothetical protein